MTKMTKDKERDMRVELQADIYESRTKEGLHSKGCKRCAPGFMSVDAIVFVVSTSMN